MATDKDETNLIISRSASRLFLKRGVANTSGYDIATASGFSKRTVWRYFRTKESCVEPILLVVALHAAGAWQNWRRDLSIEDYVSRLEPAFPKNREDARLAVEIIARLPQEPALRSAWLMSCHAAEMEWVRTINRRLGGSADAMEVRICAAAIVAAIRIFDEESCYRLVNESRKYDFAEVMTVLAQIIRKACTLPICDPLD